MKLYFQKIFHAIGKIIFPFNCVGCRVLLDEKKYFCGKCYQELAFIQSPFCEILGISLPKSSAPGSISFDALMEPPPFNKARAIFRHEALARKLITQFKYNDRLDLTAIFIEYLSIAGEKLITNCDIIIPIPLYYRRFLFRHYNQAAELAKFLAKKHNKNYQPFILKRVKNTKPQTSLKQKDRLKNMGGAFICNPKKMDLIKQKNILLLDDVYTTGATIKAACEVLAKAGVKNIDVLTLSNSYKYRI